MAYELQKVRVRQSLEPRKEPYWGPPIAPGRFLGMRKLDDTQCRWIARDYDASRQPPVKYHALGACTSAFDYEAARQAALDYFSGIDAGITTTDLARYTVRDACKDYVTDRNKTKSEACGHDAQKRFERCIYEDSLAHIPIAKLRRPRLKRWRDELRLSKGAANRTTTALVAALNLAVANRRVSSSSKPEWAGLQFRGAGNRRTTFLDLTQRQAWLRSAGDPATHDLIEGALLTGARPGELVRARVKQFDSRTQSMRFIGKTGSRDVPISGPAVTLFCKLSKGKLPNAHLFLRPDGEPYAHSDWDTAVKDAALKAGLPHEVVLTSARHAFISQAIVDGMATLTVARLCGTSLEMIEKNYGHLAQNAARQGLGIVQMV